MAPNGALTKQYTCLLATRRATRPALMRGAAMEEVLIAMIMVVRCWVGCNVCNVVRNEICVSGKLTELFC